MRHYLSNCYRCEKPQYDCVCEDCLTCFELIKDGSEHRCMVCGEAITLEWCVEELGHCFAHMLER